MTRPTPHRATTLGILRWGCFDCFGKKKRRRERAVSGGTRLVGPKSIQTPGYCFVTRVLACLPHAFFSGSSSWSFLPGSYLSQRIRSRCRWMGHGLGAVPYGLLLPIFRSFALPLRYVLGPGSLIRTDSFAFAHSVRGHFCSRANMSHDGLLPVFDSFPRCRPWGDSSRPGPASSLCLVAGSTARVLSPCAFNTFSAFDASDTSGTSGISGISGMPCMLFSTAWSSLDKGPVTV